MGVKRELKHIRGLAEVLNALAEEVEQRGSFTNENMELLKKLGSNVLFKGVALDFLVEEEKR